MTQENKMYLALVNGCLFDKNPSLPSVINAKQIANFRLRSMGCKLNNLKDFEYDPKR